MYRRLFAHLMLVSMIILMAAVIGCGERTEEPPKTGWAMPLKLGTGPVEVNLTFDVPQGTSLQTYFGWISSMVSTIQNAEGCTRCFVSTNITDSPEVKVTSWWRSLSAWSKFTSSPAWMEIRPALNSIYATDMNTEIWRVLRVMKTEKTEEPPLTDKKELGIVEVNFTIDLEPEIDRSQYRSWVEHVLNATNEAPGRLLAFASFNIWDSPEVQWTSWWNDLDAWTRFTETTAWQALSYQLHAKYALSVNIEIWELGIRTKTATMILPMVKTEEPGRTGP